MTHGFYRPELLFPMNNEFPILMDDAIGKERPPIEKLEKTFLLIEW